MISVLHLDLGAGPGTSTSLGGLAPMRRPAQHTLSTTAWSHPYTGPDKMAVFYNDGGQGGAQPALNPAAPAGGVPTPAELAARAAGQQPAAPAPAADPNAPRITDDGREVFIDKHTGQPMTQGRFSQLMTKQYEKSRNAAYREMVEALGLPYDPETFDPDTFKQSLKEGQDARQQLLTDEQRRSADIEAREQALAAREAKAKQAEEAAAARARDTKIRAALVSLGATGDDLEDATALIRIADDADDTQITKAAQELKDRRAVLFGGTPAPQTLPPAPSGGPAAGNAPRPPAPAKDAVKEEARRWANQLGYGKPDAA